MPNKSQPLLEQIAQNPLLISASAEALFQASVLHVISSEHAGAMLQTAISAASNDDDFWPTTKDDWRAAFRPYNVNANGVLQIPVMGVLLNRFPYQFGRWATGYTYIEKALQRGMADANVKAIAFVIDSPGGEVAGCFELVDKIYEARGTKPFRAFSADHAYSAAYAIFSAVGKGNGSVTRSGGVGSIGVVTAHVEYSEMLKDLGIKITFIFAGKHKVDGNPYEKLPESVKSRIQERIDRIYGVFTSTVARNRSMDEKAVRDTNALTYDANEAIEVGLADRVGALDEEMVIFSEEVAATEDEQMAQANEVKTVDQATHDAAVAAATTAGATAERTRISAILASDEGKVRPKAAMSLAMKTGLTVEEAKATLADMPEEKAETPQPAPAATDADKDKGKKPQAAGPTPFDAAMNKDNPEVGEGDGDKGANDDEKASSSILADYAGATGLKKKTA